MECPEGKHDEVGFLDIGGQFIVNRGDVGFGGTMIIVAVPESMSLLALWNETLKGMCWRNKCCIAGKSFGGSSGSSGILERVRRQASIDANLRKSLVYTPTRQRIIPPGRKLQRIRILAALCAHRYHIEDVDVL